jgi:hypothetical protein
MRIREITTTCGVLRVHTSNVTFALVRKSPAGGEQWLCDIGVAGGHSFQASGTKIEMEALAKDLLRE